LQTVVGYRAGVRRAVLFAALLLPGLGGVAQASEPFADAGVAFVSLKANTKGEAAVTYRRADGKLRRVLVWGAIDARPPTVGVPQVSFRFDYAGGWGKYHQARYAERLRSACGRYTGPALAYRVAACTLRDGSHWALQAWPRNLPHRGYPAWTTLQAAPELRISHFRGETARLEAHTDWAFDGEAHDLFGKLTYRGEPVHGFGTTRNGNPTDGYGRNLYIDTFGSAYGPGWKRETSIVFRKPSGAFCYSFWPTTDVSLPGYPGNRRPAGNGSRYRISVAGPGVTPDVVWEGKGLPDFDRRNPEHVAHEREMNALLLKLVAPDRFCPTQL
jgi:hypothetical protein